MASASTSVRRPMRPALPKYPGGDFGDAIEPGEGGLVKPRSPLADGIACCPIWDGPTNEKPRPATLLIGTSILVAGAGFEPTTSGL